jgi:hypothetical protein
MNARTIAPGSTAATPPRIDAKFIEDHRLVERYLDNQLPMRGARDLENWCRSNPAYLDALKLSDRAQSSLRLLEASGRPVDLREPRTPWWKTPFVPLGLGVSTLLCLVALWFLGGKLSLLRSELEEARTRMHQGPLVQPTTETTVRISPDRAPGIDHAKVVVNGSAPQLMELHVDMGYLKAMQFRAIVDKRDQGRALILNNLVKDSNGELRVTVNTTGLSPGTYSVRIEALASRGNALPTSEGWLLIEVH